MSNVSQSKVATKCGIRFNPPALIIIYEEGTMNNTVYKRKRVIPLRNFDCDAKLKVLASDLQSRYLTDIDINSSVVPRMLKVLKAHLNGSKNNVTEPDDTEIFSSSKDGDMLDGTLNAQTTEENKTEDIFNQNQIKPGDSNFVYDKRIDFNPNAQTDWDKDDLDNFFDME